MIDISREEFEVLIQEGLTWIPEKYQNVVKNLAIVLEDKPTTKQRDTAGIEPEWTLYGLYEGVPLPERGEHYMFVPPDKISIFRLPILEAANSLEEAREIVKNTIWHEFAHYFGLSEHEVHEREVREGRDKF